MEIYYFTEKGKRENNEDSLLLNSTLITSENMTDLKKFTILNPKHNKFLLADGMGGHSKGEVASSTVLNIFKKIKKKFSLNILNSTLFNCKEYLKFLSLTKNINKLGTTISGVFLSEDVNYAFNVGDTRIYKFSHDKIEILSYDHSCGMELVENHIISNEFLRYHVSRNILTSSITNDDSIKKINYKEFEFRENEILFICSDGVWEQLEEKVLIKLLKKYKNLKELAQSLLNIIKVNPNDNISFILIKK